MNDWSNTGKGTGWLIFWVAGIIFSLFFIAAISAYGNSTWLTPALAAYWCARRWLYAKKVIDRTEEVTLNEDVYNPYPREYQEPLQDAFAAVRTALEGPTYNISDKWRIINADTDAKRITAGIHLHRYQGDNRYLGLEVDFQDTENDTTVIMFSFDPRIEPGIGQSVYGWFNEDMIKIANEVPAKVTEKLGSWRKLTPAKTTNTYYKYDFSEVPPPSWLLLGMTVVGIIALLGDIVVQLR